MGRGRFYFDGYDRGWKATVRGLNRLPLKLLILFYSEYDISVDAEEPQQVLSFVPGKKTKSYVAEDSSEREVASFVLGKGRADWGPLTVYAVMKSGDVYSLCPYMPQNA